MKNIFKKSIIKIFVIAISFLSFTGVIADVLQDSVWADTNMCSEVDPKTGLTCDEIEQNPGEDIYYIVVSSHLDDDIWESSHQDKNTVRWNYWHTKFIVKYNASEIPRSEFGFDKALGIPMSHEDILAHLILPENGFLDPAEYDYATLMPLPPQEGLFVPTLPEEPLLEEIIPEEVLPTEVPVVEPEPTMETETEEISTESPVEEIPTGGEETPSEEESNPTLEESVVEDEGEEPGEVLGEQALEDPLEEDPEISPEPENIEPQAP